MKRLKTILITAAKIGLSLLIIGYLLWRAVDTPDGRTAFVEMLKQSKLWGLLAGGFTLLLLAVLIAMVRWCYLVRSVGIDFSVRDSLRIGFLGYLFNLSPTGIVGGDLLKTVMLAREKPGNRAKIFASVVVDRIVGLYVLFLVASAGILATGFLGVENRKVHFVCLSVLGLTLVSTAGIAWILVPGVLEGRFMRMFTRIPRVGAHVESMLRAFGLYRDRRVVLFLTSVMTVPVHVLLTLSVVMIAWGLGFNEVHWSDYFTIYPVSGIAQTIPLPAGPTEYGIVALYGASFVRLVEANPNVIAQMAKQAHQQGLILALAYRLSTVLVAPIGAVYYFLGGRREVSEVMHEIEEEEVPASP